MSGEKAKRALTKRAVQNAGAATAVAQGKIKALDVAEHLAVPIRKIVTVHGSALDELIWTLPALAALRDSFPGAVIISAVRPALGAILKETGCVDEVWPRPRGGLSAQASLMARLHACHFDLAVSFSTSRNATLLNWSSAAQQRAGFQGAHMEVLLTHRVPLHRPENVSKVKPKIKPGLYDYLELVREIGCKTHHLDARSLLHPGVEAQLKAQEMLDERGIAGEFLVANVGREKLRGEAESTAECWHRALQVLAARRTVVLIGTTSCAQLAGIENVFDFGGRVDLLVLAALCARAQAFIGGEGGLLEMAHAMQTPVVGIFDHEEAARHAPRGADKRIVLQDNEENILGAVNELIGV